MLRKLFNAIVVLILCNVLVLWNVVNIPVAYKIIALILLLGRYVWINIIPYKNKALPRKLTLLGRGCVLIETGAVCGFTQICIYLFIIFFARDYLKSNLHTLGIDALLSILLITIIISNGVLRAFFTSTQIKVANRLGTFMSWWLAFVPILNVFLIMPIYITARGEFKFYYMRFYRNLNRKHHKTCQTKYPILMVHGVFFRDWKTFNYWGRIPDELEENGATIYYGEQKSAASVEASAEELKKRILQIVNESSCEKVNIIAHSKGGMDSRYAISCLGMDKYVASLTTINTPHYGSPLADFALDKLPKNVVLSVSKEYNKLFTRLGDDKPDFFSGVNELTNEKCTELNKIMPDCTEILYQSVGSRIKKVSGAPFPLNLGFAIINKLDGDNDGLVAVDSMRWGDFTFVEPEGEQGISHGDMIDLSRKDIDKFDVREFYVGIVSKLKESGL